MSAVGQKINAPFFEFQSNEKAGRVIPQMHMGLCYSLEPGERPDSAETDTTRTSSVKSDAA